ncbi:MAG: NHLP bacteriocin export ABC transporter permease/ATPase subunit [Clostridiales bacterium]|nr:NHLP bacteriocin export ABC transporter permease/ATPase subunit [Clostridiales bacterium]
MGWFDKQIQQRENLDQQLFEDSFIRVAGIVLGHRTANKINADRIVTKVAVDDILKFYHYKPVDIPGSIKDHEEQLDFCLRPFGLMRRRIVFEDGWYKDAIGPMLAYKKENGEPVALLPGQMLGYYYIDHETGKKVKINAKTCQQFDKEGYCFYKPLPQRKIGIPDLLLYMQSCLKMNDVILIILATFAVSGIGLLEPRITKALTGPVISSGRTAVLAGIAVFLVCTVIASQVIRSVSSLLNSRISSKTSLGVEAAMMMRLMSLPANFFRQYSAGELTSRSSSVKQLCSLLVSLILGTGLSSVASLLYITQIFSYAPALVVPSLIVILVTVVFSVVSSIVQIRISKKQMELGAKESGLTYALISGIQKIKLAGAEKRFFARWLNLYSDSAELAYAPPMFIKINGVITTAITLVSNIVLYSMAVKSGIDVSSYLAFSAAYSAVSAAFSSLASTALSLGNIKPILDMAEPFLKAEPEASDTKEIVTKLSGSIELNNVYFRYGEDKPYVVNDLSLKIRSGEYIAIVGKTGCGKSTLMRLLLGFEKPEKGAIYYDGKDLNSLELSSLRRKIGTVMQSGGLFQGDIYSNIVITAPHLTLDEAWEAAEIAGIADDIRMMPMGMNTIISEGQGGISGGQKQRLMIARAVAPKPKILMFDEATSALDNKTQKQVSEALDNMGCTRIVIAHRLSTIRHCDRILVFDKGNIIEDGTYEELIAKNGFFAELVSRQRVEEN